MSVFWVLLGVVVLGGVAIVASGRGEGLVDPQPDRADLTLPKDRPAAREDVDRLRFSVGLRGYRMDEVDDVLDRLGLDIALRDGLIGELREQLAERSGYPSPAGGPEPSPVERAVVVQGAAMVPPVEVQSDPATTRTLLVPLEQYEQHEQRRTQPWGTEHAGAEESGTGQSGPAGVEGAAEESPAEESQAEDSQAEDSPGDGSRGQDPARG